MNAKFIYSNFAQSESLAYGSGRNDLRGTSYSTWSVINISDQIQTWKWKPMIKNDSTGQYLITDLIIKNGNKDSAVASWNSDVNREALPSIAIPIDPGNEVKVFAKADVRSQTNGFLFLSLKENCEGGMFLKLVLPNDLVINPAYYHADKDDPLKCQTKDFLPDKPSSNFRTHTYQICSSLLPYQGILVFWNPEPADVKGNR
jgi:hypothetical protein